MFEQMKKKKYYSNVFHTDMQINAHLSTAPLIQVQDKESQIDFSQIQSKQFNGIQSDSLHGRIISPSQK